VRSARLVIATLVLFSLSACSDDLVAVGDAAVKKDSQAKDGAAKDAPSQDSALKPDGPQVKPDGPQVKPDGPQVKPDGPVVKPDGPVVKPDGPVVKPDGPVVTPDIGPKPDKGGPTTGCTSDKGCKVFNDCCDCEAIPVSSNKPICKKFCLINTCESLGLKQPEASCVGGRCVITDRGTACTSDKDCKKVDNCCDCLALPTTVTTPFCGIKSCFVSTCTGLGLSKYNARCVQGVCRLAP
jgi:hypothetical protein